MIFKFKFTLALIFLTSYTPNSNRNNGPETVECQLVTNTHLVDAGNTAMEGPQPIPTSTENPNVTSTAPPPTTTVTPTTKPTTQPTTPSTTPPPTTPPTTPSTPAMTTSSTPTPTTPTTAPTAAPTTPAPAAKDWVVKNATSGEVCIIANMAIKIDVPYHASNNKTVNAEFEIKHNENVTASGICGHKNQTLVLTWGNNSATFEFGRKGNASYCLHSVVVVIDVNNSTFPNNTMVNVTKISFVHDAEVFSVAMNHSYTCASVNALHLNGTAWNKTGPTNGTVHATFSLTNIHAEAFGTQKDAKYSAPLDCAAHETPDAVPIVVGLILFGLVIVVLIAYLVGRRRAQARGYLSM